MEKNDGKGCLPRDASPQPASETGAPSGAGRRERELGLTIAYYEGRDQSASPAECTWKGLKITQQAHCESAHWVGSR